MRILFAGTPALAVPSLRVAALSHEVVGVLTAPDRPTGRGRATAAPPAAAAASQLGLPLLQPAVLDADALGRVRELAPDLLVVAAYGRIFRSAFLSIFPLGGINIHPSLLPLHRGPSPIPAAILGGDAETGVTVQRLALKFDTGDILAQSRHPLRGNETTATLTDELAREGAELLAGVLAEMAAGRPPGPRAQRDELASYCRPLRKEDGLVDWSEPAVRIERKVRAYDPWPRAATRLAGETLLVLKSHVHPGTLGFDPARGAPGDVLAADTEHGLLIRTGDGILAVERLQLQFKKPLDWRSFVNGHPAILSVRLGA